MNRSTYALLVVWASFGSGFGSAQERPVLAQEYTGESGTPVFWWTRRQDEYTLQFVTGVVFPKAMGNCERLAEPPPGMNRGSFFIGNTIACLRGLDPTFGGRTLTLIDGRRAPGAVPAPVSPPVTQALPPADPEQPPPELEAWLLHRDGSIIIPARKSPVDPDGKYCAYGRCESGFVYGFDLSVGRDAVAVVYRMSDDVRVQQLQPFADEVD